MSKRKEKISAFLDGDMHRDELMSFSLSAEADDAKTAQRYHLMGDALRGEVSESSFIDVSVAVREALANENIAEQMPAIESVSKPATQSVATEKAGLFDLTAWFKPVAGMAIAAFVAVVMVISVGEQDSASSTPVAINNEVQQPVLQLTVDDKSINNQIVNNETVNNETGDLNPYINQHLEFATQDTLQGRLPYVRAVSFESEK